MNRLLLAGAAYLALTGLALAQTPPENTPPPLPQTEAPDVAVTPAEPSADAPDTSTASRPEGRPAAKMRDGRDHQMKRQHGDRMGHGHMGREMGRHGPGHMSGSRHGRFHRGGRSDGASFTFEGPRGGSVDINCAAGESTQECVDAVLPMLRNLMQEFHGARNRP